MTPIEKWPVLRAAWLVMAMLYVGASYGAQPTGSVSLPWFNPWPEEEVTVRSSPPPPEAKRKPERKPQAKVGTAPVGEKSGAKRSGPSPSQHRDRNASGQPPRPQPDRGQPL